MPTPLATTPVEAYALFGGGLAAFGAGPRAGHQWCYQLKTRVPQHQMLLTNVTPAPIAIYDDRGCLVSHLAAGNSVVVKGFSGLVLCLRPPDPSPKPTRRGRRHRMRLVSPAYQEEIL